MYTVDSGRGMDRHSGSGELFQHRGESKWHRIGLASRRKNYSVTPLVSTLRGAMWNVEISSTVAKVSKKEVASKRMEWHPGELNWHQ